MSKLHYVFLVGSYAPNYSAVGVCASNIVNCLKENNRISVISLKNEEQIPLKESINEVVIHRIEPKSIKLLNLPKFYPYGIKNTIGNFISILYRLKRYLMDRFYNKLMINNNLTECYLSKLEDISLTEPIDCIIACCSPFETIIATSKYCKHHNETKCVAYLFDPFSDNQQIYRTNQNYKNKFLYNIAFEKQTLKQFDLIIAMHIWEKHLNKHYSSDYRIEIAEHPLLKIDNTERNCKYEGRRILYAGALNSKVRNPSYAFRFIEKILNHSNNIEFNIYSSDYISEFRRIEQKHPNRFHFHGRKQLEDIHFAEYSNDIMLSIGNSPNTAQTPSKIFEYIATGNPIIHLAKYREDPCISVLAKYNNALILYEDQEYDLQYLLSQISNLKPTTNKQILSELYLDATPEFVVNKISKLFS